jgi:hypothetical protein
VRRTTSSALLHDRGARRHRRQLQVVNRRCGQSWPPHFGAVAEAMPPKAAATAGKGRVRDGPYPASRIAANCPYEKTASLRPQIQSIGNSYTVSSDPPRELHSGVSVKPIRRSHAKPAQACRLLWRTSLQSKDISLKSKNMSPTADQ